jgi:hypothetical protein
MNITGAPSKSEAVAMALNETARKYRLMEILRKGSGVPAGQLDTAYDPKSFAVCRTAQDRARFGKYRSG